MKEVKHGIRFTWLVRLLTLLGLMSQFPCDAQMPLDSLSERLESIMDQSSIVGFGTAIYNAEGLIHSEGFGFADQEKRIRYTDQTTQKVASISKLLLGTALMKAISMDLLQLEDGVNRYLPFPLVNPFFPDREITIKHLATHTSGIEPSKHDIKALVFPTPIPSLHKEMPFGLRRIFFKKGIRKLNKNEKLTMVAFLQEIYSPEGKWYSVTKNFSKEPPGQKRMYSNNGAAMIALIIEKATGMSYIDFVQTYILNPLDMDASGFDFVLDDEAIDGSSSLYHMGFQVPGDYELIIYPAGGFVTSVADFAKYMSSTIRSYRYGEGLLSEEHSREMLSRQFNPDFDQGILWEVYDRSVGHSGDIAGVTAFTYFSKTSGVGYILFCNTAATKSIAEETRRIIDLLEGYCRQDRE